MSVFLSLQLLPVSWWAVLTVEQQRWIGRVLFSRSSTGRAQLISQLNVWWYPPQARPIYSQPPASPDPFFACRLFLWMPHRIWGLQLTCPPPSLCALGPSQRLGSIGPSGGSWTSTAGISWPLSTWSAVDARRRSAGGHRASSGSCLPPTAASFQLYSRTSKTDFSLFYIRMSVCCDE